MKKLFLLLAAAGMIFTACENFGTEDSQQPYLEFDGGEELLSLDFPSDGMSGEVVTFSTNYDWSVTTSDEWIKVTPDSGKAGDESQITISLDRNDTYDVRNGKITIYVQELSIEVPISQQPKNGLALSTTEVALPQSGGAFDITVLSNVDFEYEIKVDWISPAETRALAENKVRFEAEANSTTDPRTGEIVFKGEGLTATLTVTQSQTNVVTLSTSTVEMEGEEGTFSVDVSANIDYEVAIEDGCDWISRVDSRSVTTSTLTFAVSKNETEAARSATISISGEDIEETITVNQGYIVSIPNNTIYYTSTDGNIVEPKTDAVYGATIVSNTYENGVGVIAFDGDVTHIGTNAFENCATLVSITIPESVTVIGSGAFDNCTSLTSITIPDSVIAIGMHPFLNCTSLTAFYGKFASEDNLCLIIDGDLISFAIGCGVTEYTIPDSVTGCIGVSAFASCSSLRSITIPNSVTSSISNGAFQNCSSLTSIIIPDSITGVGAEVFSGCTALTSVTIGNSVTLIGTSAFSGCTSLTSITIPNSVTRLGGSVFKDCTSLTSATIGNSVTSIYSHAFDGCSSLTSIIIPDSVTSIGNSAFYNCTSLTSVTIPDGVTVISNLTFQNCSSLASVTIPNGVTSIGTQAFLGCSSLTSITIPDSVTEMGRYAFYKCTSLKEVYCKPTTPPTGNIGIFNNNATDRKIYVPTASFSAYKVATYWSDYAAYFVCYDFEKGEIVEVASKIIYTSTDGNIVTPYATDVFGANIVSNIYENGMGVITFDAPVTSIGDYAFYGCTSLTSITIPDSVTSIGMNAFWKCSSLTSVTIGKGVTSIGRSAFHNCTSLPSVTIPDSVTLIVAGAFANCTSLTTFYGKYVSEDNRCLIVDSVLRSFAPAGITSYAVPDGVTSIGIQAFFACNKLKNVTMPNSVTSIGGQAFGYCRSLTSVTIPENVTSIGNHAFQNCSSLTNVYCKPTTPPAGDVGMFSSNATSRKIYVPTASVDAYKAATYWSDYASYIVGYNF